MGEATATGSLRKAYVAVVTWGDGRAASSAHRPGGSSYTVFGGCDALVQERGSGSGTTPVSVPLRRWSHRRGVSWGKPVAGVSGMGAGHGAGRKGYSWSYRVSEDIPVSPGLCVGDGKALTVIES